MKKFTTWLFLLLATALAVQAQSFADTTWTRTMGGSLDEPYYIDREAKTNLDIATDGGIFMLTNTTSYNGWINDTTRNQDCWLIKMNTQGDTLWTNVFGGDQYDAATAVVAMPDGGCAVCGFTSSNEGDLTGNHDGSASGRPDGFIVRFSETGEILWSKLYGGSSGGAGGYDKLYDILLNPEGKLVAVGESSSINGDLPLDFTMYGGGWFLKVEADNGTVLKSHKLVGPNHSEWNSSFFYKIVQTENANGYLVAGSQNEILNNTIWVAGLSNDGAKLWEKMVGSNSDVQIRGLASSATGGAVVVSYLKYLASENTETVIGESDVWTIEIDNTGTITQQSLYGGTNHDIPYDIISDRNGGYYLSCHTLSEDIYTDQSSNFGNADFWLLHLDSQLDTIATYRMGGSGSDALSAAAISQDGDALYISGYSTSNDGFLHTNYGGRDIWVAKFWNETVGISEINTSKFRAYPNPVKNNLAIENIKHGLIIYNLFGQKVLEQKTTETKLSLNVSSLSKGIYFLKSGDETIKFIKQ